MTREAALTLADRVRESCPHSVQVSPDDEFFVVKVTRSVEGGTDTYTLYGEDDWAWLRDRIAGP